MTEPSDTNSAQKPGATGKNPDEASWRAATKLVRGGAHRTPFGETAEALFLTSGYVYDSAEQAEARFKGEDDGFVYSRFANPSVRMFEDRMCLLEGAPAARATATGMAAVTASLLCHLEGGDHVVASQALFGSCRFIVETLLPKFGIESTLVDGRDLDAWQRAVKPNTKTFFLESPSNPTLEIIDIKAVADIAHAAKARLVVDNVFATPILQKPMTLGADVVVYSATKHIDGQGRCLGGIVLAADPAFVDDHLGNFLRQTGPALSPFNAWVLTKALETLDLRIRRMCDNAKAVADHLAGHAKLENLSYPGRPDHPQHELAMRQMDLGGTVLTFKVKGGKDAAFRTANALRLIDISNNLGDAKSLITHPSTTTHQRLTEEARVSQGITQNMLRVSIGLEDPADLIEDLERALSGA